jgi:DNA-binding GntR family transcriptional regulator
MRGKLESLCVRYMREAAKPEPKVILGKALRKMKSAAASNDNEKFFHADMELHQTIWKLSGQPQLFRTLNWVMSPFIFLIARTYSSAQPIKEQLENHSKYIDLILETPRTRVEQEVEQYFEKLYEELFHNLFPPMYPADGESWLGDDFLG